MRSAALTSFVLAMMIAGCTQRAQPPTNPRVEAFAKLPDWSGLWEPNVFVGQGIGQDLSSEGSANAQKFMLALSPFTPEWQAKFDAAKAVQAAAIAADPKHPPALPYNDCSSPPFIVSMTSPALYEWRVTPEETTIVDTLNGIRHIYTDGRSHPPADELWPTKTGDSVGHWEGDTLAVDTVAIKPDILIPLPGVLVRMSDQLHLVERFRMVGPDELDDAFTLEDPIALTQPFEISFKFVRVKNTKRMIDQTECDSTTDRNPIVNGRFTSITTR
jgi:hypothetical protein